MSAAATRWATIAATVVIIVAGAAMTVATAEDRTTAKALTVPVPRPYVDVLAEKYFPVKAEQAPAARIFRLTREQIDATVKSLLPSYFETSVKSVMARDPLQTNYEYAELLSINGANFGGLTGWLGEIAARVRKNPAGVIKCPGNDASCVETQARRFVVKAFRGDVSDEKLKQITDFFLARVKEAGTEQATGDLVEVVLNSPQFLFRQEIDSEKERKLVQARRLQSLTYTLADVPPEAIKLQSDNAAQYFSTGQAAATMLGSVLADTAVKNKLKRFFTAWLEIKEPADFTISPNYYPDFNPKLAAAMLSETDQFLDAQLKKGTPKLRDITQGASAPAPRELDAIYAKSPSEQIAALISADAAPQRMGIFSLPAVLASHSGPTSTRPIKRGVFWGRKVMCMNMQPAPANLHVELYDLPGATERQRIEQSTNRPACAGCHSIINPLGFFQESYDAIGKWRTEDNSQPVDSSITIDFLGEGPKKTTQSPVEAMKVLTSSTMFKQCFVRQLFRFYMGRNEEASDDPVLRRMFLKFSNSDQDILKTVSVLAASDRILMPE